MLTAKKLVDCYRYGSVRKNPDILDMRRQHIELEEDGDLSAPRTQRYSSHMGTKRSAMRTKNGWERKDFGENLSPLWRFIDRSVGRPWDAIYADICKNMDRRSTVGAHIFQHLWDYVERDPIMVDGVPHEPPTRWQMHPIVYRGKLTFSKQFWIDPKDGILKRGIKPQKSKYDLEIEAETDQRKQNLVKVDSLTWLSRHPETKIWFLLEYIPQEYTTRKDTRYVQVRNGSYEAVEYDRKVSVHTKAPHPEGLKWFPHNHSEEHFGSKGEFVLAKVTSASKNLLRKMNL